MCYVHIHLVMGAAASIGDELDLTSADIRLREKLKAELFQTNGGFSPDTLLCAFRKFDQVRGQTWVILELISYIQDHDNVLSNDEFRMVLSELGCDLDEQQVAQIVPRILGDRENIIIGEIGKVATHSGVHLDEFVRFFGRDSPGAVDQRTARQEKGSLYSKQTIEIPEAAEQATNVEAEAATKVIQYRARNWLSERNSSAVVIQAQVRGQMARNLKPPKIHAQPTRSDFYGKREKDEIIVQRKSFEFAADAKDSIPEKGNLVSQSLNDQGWMQGLHQGNQHQSTQQMQQRAHDMLQLYFDKGGAADAILRVLVGCALYYLFPNLIRLYYSNRPKQ